MRQHIALPLGRIELNAAQQQGQLRGIQLQQTLNPGWPVEEAARQRLSPDPLHPGEFLVWQADGQWFERTPYYEAVALTGEGVFDTLKAVSKIVLKSLG